MKEKESMKEQGLDELYDKLEEYNDQIVGQKTDKQPLRDFTAKYALLYANDTYDQFRKISKDAHDIKEAKDDLMNAYATASMMGIPENNIKKLVNCQEKELNQVFKEMCKKVL